LRHEVARGRNVARVGVMCALSVLSGC